MKENKIREILKGIDKTESESEDGWWETSEGAEFGRKKLEELIEYSESDEVRYHYNPNYI